LSGRGLCDELITRPEESYRLWCVVVCDLETSRMRRPLPALSRSATKKNIYLKEYVTINVAIVIHDKTLRNIQFDYDNLRITGEKRVKRTNTPTHIMFL
jgi:hypothetical protein